jgi:hypothetical protein
MRTIPAGIETTLRRNGTQRASNTIVEPCRSNSWCPRSMSCRLARMNHGRPASRYNRS